MFPKLSTGEADQISGKKNLPPDNNEQAPNLHTGFIYTHTKIILL